MHAITRTHTHTRRADGQEIETRKHKHAHAHTGNKCGIGTWPDLPPGPPAWTPRGPAWQRVLAHPQRKERSKNILRKCSY